jgi:hypothetical protein
MNIKPIMEILELHLPRRNKLDNIALATALADCCFDRKIKVKSRKEDAFQRHLKTPINGGNCNLRKEK